MKLAELKNKKSIVYGSGSAAAILIVVVILTFLAMLAERYPWRWDASQDQGQSLSPTTKSLLAEVKEPLQLSAFFPEGQTERQAAKELLENYRYQNRLLTYSFVDPERQPLEAKQAGFRYPGNVYLEYQGRKQMANNATEDAITTAIRKLLKPVSKKVYFLTGHGERGLKEGQRGGLQVASQSLGNEGFEIMELNLLLTSQVPVDAAVIVVAGPEKPFFPNEVTALKDYLNRGGRIMLMLEPFKDVGLKNFLAAYGIELDDRMILDANQVSRALGASVTMPLVIQYGAHKITQDFTNVVTIFPLARPLYPAKESPKGVQLITLATTTGSSWAKQGQDWQKTGKVEFDQNQDRKGPFALEVLAEIKLPGVETKGKPENKEDKSKEAAKAKPEETKAYLAVVGDTDFADNRYFNLSGNGDLFMNTVNFLAGEESQITVRSTEKKSQPLVLTGYQGWMLFLVALVLIPLGMIIAGVQAYVRRRARR